MRKNRKLKGAEKHNQTYQRNFNYRNSAGVCLINAFVGRRACFSEGIQESDYERRRRRKIVEKFYYSVT